MPDLPPEFYEDDDIERLLEEVLFPREGKEGGSGPTEGPIEDSYVGPIEEPIVGPYVGPIEEPIVGPNVGPIEEPIVEVPSAGVSLGSISSGLGIQTSGQTVVSGSRMHFRTARRKRVLRLTRTAVIAITLLLAIFAQLFGGSSAKTYPGSGAQVNSAHKAGASGSVNGGPNSNHNNHSSKPVLAFAKQKYAPSGPFPVGEQSVSLTDTNRFIYLPNGTKEPRQLATTILYPSYLQQGVSVQKVNSISIEQSSRPYLKAGPYPIIFFAPGYRQVPSTYLTLLSTWAQAGYVVVGVTFPLTNPNAPGGPNEQDLINQPQDINFLVGKFSNQANYASLGLKFLSGLVDPTAIILAGHSDGGDTVLAAAYNTCCNKYTYRGVLDLSGAELNEPANHYFPPGGPPLMVVQGTSDTVNPPSFSQTVYAGDTSSPKYYLSLLGAGYINEYAQPDSYEQIVARVSLDFLGAYSKANAKALSQISHDGTVTGLATLTDANLNLNSGASVIAATTIPTTTTTSSAAAGSSQSNSSTTSSTSQPTIAPNPGAGTTIESTSTTIFIPSG